MLQNVLDEQFFVVLLQQEKPIEVTPNKVIK